MITAVPTGTAVPTATPTLDLSRKYGGWSPHMLAYNPTVQAAATIAMQGHLAALTAIALTPTVPPVPREATETPAPTPTLGVGMIADEGCFVAMRSGEPVFPSCWNAQVNGQWLLVAVGSEGDSRNQDPDWPLRGLLWISTDPYVHPPRSPEFYDAPRPDLHIVAVDGTQVILASRDPAVQDTFVFDLVTRQWVTSTPTPAAPP